MLVHIHAYDVMDQVCWSASALISEDPDNPVHIQLAHGSYTQVDAPTLLDELHWLVVMVSEALETHPIRSLS